MAIQQTAVRRLSLLALVPNALSLLRLGLGLSFPWLPSSWRLGVVLLALLTDVLDGTSGRLLGVCSDTGRVLDPLADKVFLLAVVLTLMAEGVLGVGELLLLGLRDLAVLAGVIGGVLTADWEGFRRGAPTRLGKAATAAQFAFLLVVLTTPQRKALVLPVAATLSGLAALQYLGIFLGRYRSRRPSATAPL
jgi:CDP-diacylglycerol---glycerol-3-phosphate 3-phosphatidyltransferase